MFPCFGSATTHLDLGIWVGQLVGWLGCWLVGWVVGWLVGLKKNQNKLDISAGSMSEEI